MARWNNEQDFEQDGMRIKIECEHGQHPRRCVSAVADGGFYHSEWVDWNVWEGHCSGHLWMPDYLERAKAALAKHRHEGVLSCS